MYDPRRAGIVSVQSADKKSKSALGQADMSSALADAALGQERTFGAAAKTTLFDHLVGGGEQRCRNLEAERFGGFLVDYQPEFGRQLHRQVGGFFPAASSATTKRGDHSATMRYMIAKKHSIARKK
jgi:hypothetical protein